MILAPLVYDHELRENEKKHQPIYALVHLNGFSFFFFVSLVLASRYLCTREHIPLLSSVAYYSFSRGYLRYPICTVQVYGLSLRVFLNKVVQIQFNKGLGSVQDFFCSK